MKLQDRMTSNLREITLASRLFLALAALSLCVAVALLAWYQGAFTPTLRVVFFAGTADGMYQGMAVKLVGFKVGAVDGISINNDLRVRVTLKIDRKYVPMIDAGATIRLAREGLIGGNVLEIRPGSGDAGPITRQSILRYEREPSIETAAATLVDQMTPIVINVTQITEYFSNPESEFRQAIRNVNRTAASLNEASGELKKLIAVTADRVDRGEARLGAALDTAGRLMNSAEASVAVMDRSLRRIDAALPGIASKMDESLENIRATSETVRRMVNGELTAVVGETGGLVSDSADVMRGAKRAWPVSGLVEPRQELLLRLDSGGGLSPVPVGGPAGR